MIKPLMATAFFLSSASAAMAGPNVTLGPWQSHQLNLSNMTDGHTYPTVAGGAAHCTGNWAGWYAGRPDFAFQLTGGSGITVLTLETSGACDTTLVVVGPGGSAYDDDSGDDTNSRVNFNIPQAGRYLVFVGTYAEGTCSTRLNISTHQDAHLALPRQCA